MRKLLIADGSDAFTGALQSVLKDDFELQICHDGESALSLLQSFQPDGMVINVILPVKDGLSVLRESAFRPRVILSVTNLINDYVIQAAQKAGVQYLLIMPAIAEVRARLLDMMSTVPTGEQDFSQQVVAHLHTLGIQPHLDGFQQLRIGIPIFARNPDMLLSKELYPQIAAHFGLPDSRTVEHSIRKAIETAWRHRNPAVWEQYFAPRADGVIVCPTNKVFFCRIAGLLKL